MSHQKIPNADPILLDYAFQPTKQLISFLFLIIFLVVVSLYYFFHVKKLKESQLPNGFAFLIFLYLNWINKLSLEILGPRYQRFTPFFIYLFTLLFCSNMFSVLGLDPIGISYVVPLSLALFTFLVMLISGIKFQKWSYTNQFITWLSFKKVRLFPLLDPLKIIGKIIPVVSLSFRFWGNIFASSLITGMIYSVFQNYLFGYQGIHWFGSIFTGLIVFPFHFYFDLLDGTIQPLIFMMLTMVYWAIEADLNHQEKTLGEEGKPVITVEESYTKKIKQSIANL